jgi:hypothetical protein
MHLAARRRDVTSASLYSRLAPSAQAGAGRLYSDPLKVNAVEWAYTRPLARVDPQDDEVLHFIVHHYRYDPEPRERRHVMVAAFDNDEEFLTCIETVRTENECRKSRGQPVGPRDHASGAVLEPVYPPLRGERAPGDAGTATRRQARAIGSMTWSCPRTCPLSARKVHLPKPATGQPAVPALVPHTHRELPQAFRITHGRLGRSLEGRTLAVSKPVPGNRSASW